jgi:hypothetical protein
MIAGLVAAVVSGCTTAADAGSAFGDSQLVNEIANRLTNGAGESYTATYALAGQHRATLAHSTDADTTSYRFPDGIIVLAPGTATSCTAIGKASACSTMSANPAQPAIDETLETDGMIRPEAVIAKLAQTSVNADAIIAESDRTVAGTDETCVSVTGVPAADQFTACVTNDGLLGAFTGSINGYAVDEQLVDFTMSVDASSLATP